MATTTYDAQWAVRAEGLVKIFGTNRAVDGVDLKVKTGTVYGVLGPNGAGKTTTIRMLATLLRADGGTAKIFGHDIRTEGHIVRSFIGVTGQYASVDEKLSGTENLVLFGKLLGLSSRAAKKRASELLEEFHLTEAASKPLSTFSGGMRRRLDLATSLISRPPLIFLDEPTTGLDPRTRIQMWNTVRDLVNTGSTIVLTTQYLDEADQLADRIGVIDRGKVVAEGTSDELKSSVGSSSLHVSLTDTSRLSEVEQLLKNSLGLNINISTEKASFTAPLNSTAIVTDALLQLRNANIEVAEINVQKPSLDEVFLTLTGRTAREQNEGGDVEKTEAEKTLEREGAK